MQILSATEAISPAIARTRLVLFKPFLLGRSWKLSAAAYVSTAGSFFFPFPLLFIFMLPAAFRDGPKWMPLAIASGTALFLALTTFLFVLCSRLQFPVMDTVMNRSVFIAPLWRHYGPQARRWGHAKMLIGTIATVVMAIPFGVLFWTFMPGIGRHPVALGHQQFPVHFAAFFLSILLIYAGLALVVLFMSLLNDFMLPMLALEDAAVLAVWEQVMRLVRAEPGQVALYALLKVVLGFIAQIVGIIAIEIVFFILMMVFGLLGTLLSTVLHAAGLPNVILSVLGVIVFGALYIGFFYATMFSYGIPIVFLEAYKLYFLGGRYPPLGDLLDASTPPPQTYIPPPNYLAYTVPSQPAAPPPTNNLP